MKILSILAFLLSCLMLSISIYDLVEYPSRRQILSYDDYNSSEIGYATELIKAQPQYNTPIYNSGNIIGYETHKIQNVNFIYEMNEKLEEFARKLYDLSVISIFQVVFSAIFFLYTLYTVLNSFFALSLKK
ncbi:MAG: hypothetical protein ACK4V4_08695 [Sphingobacteriales bacterium]|jgi:hypothetical protein